MFYKASPEQIYKFYYGRDARDAPGLVLWLAKLAGFEAAFPAGATVASAERE